MSSEGRIIKFYVNEIPNFPLFDCGNCPHQTEPGSESGVSEFVIYCPPLSKYFWLLPTNETNEAWICNILWCRHVILSQVTNDTAAALCFNCLPNYYVAKIVGKNRPRDTCHKTKITGYLLELQTKVHTKVHNHGEGPYSFEALLL